MYEELKKLAEKAGGVEWIMIDGDCGIEADSRFITSDRRIREDKIPFAEIHYGHPAAGMLEPFQGEQVAAAEFIAAANPSAVLALIAENDRLERETKRVNASWHGMKRDLDQLKAENEALRQSLRDVMTQVDGNIRETVRDCVNGHNDVQDIYGYCDTIEGLIDAAMSKDSTQ